MAKDLLHDNVREALVKDGWEITHDPFRIAVEEIGYEIDLGAERLIAATNGKDKILVEIKSFRGQSLTYEFHRAFRSIQLLPHPVVRKRTGPGTVFGRSGGGI